MKRQRVALLAQRLEGLSPMGRLEAGFAFVTGPQGRMIKKTEQVVPGDALQVEVTDGTIHAIVQGVKKRG